MKLLLPASLALIALAAPASAIETCRFIPAKADREACYHRQEEELATKRKPAPVVSNESTIESLQQMRRDDEEVYRSMHGICRGC